MKKNQNPFFELVPKPIQLGFRDQLVLILHHHYYILMQN